MTSPAPVSLCLIVKDEPRLREHLAGVRPYVKQICVLDTGSSLDSIRNLRALEAEGVIDTLRIGGPGEFDYHGIPIDFAKARNASFDLAREPWIAWMDGDDEIAGAERLPAIVAEFEGYRPYNKDREFNLLFPYEYSYDALGRAELIVQRTRLMSRRTAWNWNWIVHEDILTVPGQLEARFERGDVIWKHRRQSMGKDGANASKRNWALLQAYWEHEGKEGPVDTRMAFYTGMTLRELGRHDEALVYFRKAIENQGIDEDILITALRLCGMFLDQGKFTEALAYAFLAMRAKEDWGQGYLAAALVYSKMADKEDWTHGRTIDRLLHWGKLGLEQPYRSWFGDPRDRLHVMTAMAIALDHKSRYAEALEICERGLKEYPGDATLERNRDLMFAVVEEEKMVTAAGRLKEIRARGGSHERVVDRATGRLGAVLGFGGVAGTASTSPVEELLPLREDGKLRILFACGNSWQPWNPRIVEDASYRGGGSEIAVVELSKMLSALGHEVTVATDCGEPGVYDGVKWVLSETLGVPQKTDVLVCWRIAAHVDFPVTARLRVLWCHDVMAHTATEKNLARYDRVVALSKYHREVLRGNHPSLLEEKIAVVRSGAHASRFKAAVEQQDMSGLASVEKQDSSSLRNAHKVVWNMSPDRGLIHLLNIWKDIRARVPDAELHIFYGWDMWARMGTDPMGLVAVQHLVRTLASEGVIYRERVSREELDRELLSAGVWAYPCTFPEIFCVAAVEAQMAGLRVVVNPVGALAETILDGAKLPGALDTADAKKAWAEVITLAMTHEGLSWGVRSSRAAVAQDAFDLAPLGAVWQDMFLSLLAEKAELAPFESALAAAE